MRKPNNQTDEALGRHGAALGSAAEVCMECGCKYPGHKLDCKSSNERARKYQAELTAKYMNRGRRKRKQPNACMSHGGEQIKTGETK